MPGQPGLIAPYAGVVHNNGGVDTVGRVIDGVGRIGINHPHFIAVGDKALPLFVDADGAVKRAVHRIPAQQAGPLEQIVGRLAAARHHGAQAKGVAPVRFVDKDARHQAPDATEAVKDDIDGLVHRMVIAVDQVVELSAHVLVHTETLAVPFVVVVHREAADIDMRGPEIQRAHGLQNRIGLALGQFVTLDLAHIAMRLHQV